MCAYVSPYVCGHICVWYMGQGVCLHTHACVCLQMSKVMLGIFFNLFYLIHQGRVSQSTPELADTVSLASSLLWASLPLLSKAGMTGEYLSCICMDTWDLHFHSLASGASTLLCETQIFFVLDLFSRVLLVCTSQNVWCFHFCLKRFFFQVSFDPFWSLFFNFHIFLTFLWLFPSTYFYFYPFIV